MNQVIVENYDNDTRAILKCICGGINLHQDRVQTFWREGEDADKQNGMVSENGHNTAFMLDRSKNPSTRRDGMLVRFECENCDAQPELAIYQHKGTTYLEWKSARQKL